MPFCSQCGNQVGNRDAFCGRCGSRQPIALGTAARPVVIADPLAAISPRKFSILCYVPVVGWIAAVVVLGMKKFRNDYALRFHAFQGLYIFASWLVVDWAIGPIFAALPHDAFRVDHLLKLMLIGVWVFMLVKTSHGETYALPVLGELAQRSAREK